MESERRYFQLRQGDDGGRTLTGTAIRYDDCALFPWGRERIEAGAFQPLPADVVLNFQHDRGRPLARTGGGGLTITDDSSSMEIRAELPETREASDVLQLVRQKIVRGLSLEFLSGLERFEGDDLRIIQKATLVGIGVVDSPAYSQSEVSARMSEKETRRPAPRRMRRFYL